MRNPVILTLLVTVLTGTAWISASGPRTGTVEGEFAEYIRADGQRAFLIADEGESGQRLDSCLILNRRFSLTGGTPRKGRACHIEFSQFDIRPEVRLEQKTTVRLRITAEAEPIYLHLPDNELCDDNSATDEADSLRSDSLRLHTGYYGKHPRR